MPVLYVSIKSYRPLPFWKPPRLLTCSRFCCPLLIVYGTTKYIELGACMSVFYPKPVGTFSVFHFDELSQANAGVAVVQTTM